ALHRRVDEFVDAGELDDRVELARDLGPGHAHDRALQVDVLATGEIRVKAGGHFDQRADAPVDRHLAARRPENLREQLQDRRLAGAIRSDDAERFPRPDLERHVTGRPEFLFRQLVGGPPAQQAPGHRRDEISQAVVPLAAAELLPDVIEDDATHDQRFSANSNSARWKNTHARPNSAAEAAKVRANAPSGARPSSRTARNASIRWVIGLSVSSAPRRPPTRPIG